MIFVEYPEWLNSYDSMVERIAQFLMKRQNIAFLSVNRGHMSLITVIDFDTSIVTNMMIDNRDLFIEKMRNAYVNLDPLMEPEMRVFRWIIDKSNINHMLCITRSKMLDI